MATAPELVLDFLDYVLFLSGYSWWSESVASTISIHIPLITICSAVDLRRFSLHFEPRFQTFTTIWPKRIIDFYTLATLFFGCFIVAGWRLASYNRHWTIWNTISMASADAFGGKFIIAEEIGGSLLITIHSIHFCVLWLLPWELPVIKWLNADECKNIAN